MEKSMDYQESVKAFKSFVCLRNKVALWLSVVVLICYYVFVLGIGLFPDILGYRLGPSSITVGILAGIFLIILFIIVTGIYTFLANQYFDKQQEEILERLENSGGLEDLKNGSKY